MGSAAQCASKYVCINFNDELRRRSQPLMPLDASSFLLKPQITVQPTTPVCKPWPTQHNTCLRHSKCASAYLQFALPLRQTVRYAKEDFGMRTFGFVSHKQMCYVELYQHTQKMQSQPSCNTAGRRLITCTTIAPQIDVLWSGTQKYAYVD